MQQAATETEQKEPQLVTVRCVASVTRKRLLAACTGLGISLRDAQVVPTRQDTYLLTLSSGLAAADAARRLSGCQQTIVSASAGPP